MKRLWGSRSRGVMAVLLVAGALAAAAIVRTPGASATNGAASWVAYVGTGGTTTEALAFPTNNIAAPVGRVAPASSGGAGRSVAISPDDGTVFLDAGSSLDRAGLPAPTYVAPNGTTSAAFAAPAAGNSFTGLAVSPNGNHVYAATSTGVFATGGPFLPYPAIPFETPAGTTFHPIAVALSADGSTVFVGGSIKIPVEGISASTTESLPAIYGIPVNGHTPFAWYGNNLQTDINDSITALAVTPDDQMLWATEQTPAGGSVFRLTLPSSGGDQLEPGNALATFPQNANPTAIAISPNGSTVFVGTSGETTTAVYRLSTIGPGIPVPVGPTLGPTNTGRNNAITGLAVTPDSRTLLVTANFGLKPVTGQLLSVSLDTMTMSAPQPAPPGVAYQSIAITPDNAPHAHINGSAITSLGTDMTFDASSSTVAFGPITYLWHWNGGSCTGQSTPAITCSFSVPGMYDVSVIESSAAGTSIVAGLAPSVNGVDFTGQTASRVASNLATTTVAITVNPAPTSSTPTIPPTTAPSSATTKPPSSSSSSSSTSTTLPSTSHPQLTVNPGIGPPGFVTQVSGTGFPANIALTVTWSVGIGSSQVTTSATGTFSTPMLVMPNDTPGNRLAQVATFPGVTAPFLVVPGSLQPGGDRNSIVFRR